MNSTEEIRARCGIIATTEIAWFDPSKHPPPFDMKLMLMMAGNRSNDAGRSWQPYTVVMTGRVAQRGPSDEYDDELTIDAYRAGDSREFMDYQFCLEDDDGEELDDWWSDSIVAWAYYPLGVGQQAIDIERQRQADKGIANWSASI